MVKLAAGSSRFFVIVGLVAVTATAILADLGSFDMQR
jgi:hypothetical protein